MKRWMLIWWLPVLAAVSLTACGSRAPRPERVAGAPAPLVYPKVEIVYNSEVDLLVVGGNQLPMLGVSNVRVPTEVVISALLDKRPIDKAVVERSAQFQAAVENSLNERPLQLHKAFAEQIAAELRKTGREVKLTSAERAIGRRTSEMEVPGHTPLPGYATVVLLIFTPYEASDMISPYHAVSGISYRIRDESGGKIAADSIIYRRGGPAYYSFDAMLKDARRAYGGLEQQLSDSVSTISGYFPAREDAE